LVYNVGVDRRTIITLGLILALITGAFSFLLLNPGAKQAMQKNLDSSVSQSAKESGLEDKPAEQAQPGRYIAYSKSFIDVTEGTKLIFFYAPWCPQCRALENDIREKGVPSGVTILKADYDSNQALRKKYGVTIQTTIVKVDDEGELVKKYVAYDEPSLESVVRNLLR
jgi:thiol-disulfide isomerase/thioredoxin